MQTFFEYALHRVKSFEPDRLKDLYRLLKAGGLVVVDKTNEQNDPHLWVQAHPTPQEFSGIRVYLLGNICAFRVQKLETTEPYGKAYLMDLQGIFDKILEKMGNKAQKSSKEAVKELIKSVSGEINAFYHDSIKDEEEFVQDQLYGPERSDVGGAALVPSSGFDYSMKVYADKN
jgi:hypothetical protein